MEVQTGVARTGVVGILRGGKEGRTVALRADMDALKIQELTGLPYASKIENRMHACGHDGHTAILMGTARMLSDLKDRLAGNVKFIFQPAEEGGAGGKIMCDQGVLSDPDVDAVFALHSNPHTEVGCIKVKYGAVMAAADSFKLVVKGLASHAAEPHKGVDPITISAKVIDNLQCIISRERDPLDPVVIAIGTIHGGTARNAIPDEVVLEGSIRTLSPETRKSIPEAMRRVIKGTVQAFRGNYAFECTDGYPATINDPEMVNLVREVGIGLLGEDKVLWQKDSSMGGEDFSFFLQAVPGAMFMLGIGPKDGKPPVPPHSPRFDFNDDAIIPGMSIFSETVLRYLAR
jgi:amidohydrolase